MSLFGTSVLIVSDDKEQVVQIKDILRNKQPPGWNIQYQIKVVSTLQVAKQFLKAGGWDVILLNLLLPNGAGVAVFRSCYELAKAPIVCLINSVELETIQAVLREGAARCFPKEMIGEQYGWLNLSILACIEHYRLRQQVEQMQGTIIGQFRPLIKACAGCQKWQDASTGEYLKIEVFLEHHNIFISHGFCSACAQEKYAEFMPPNEGE